jgi:hypothetical protein
MKQLTLSAALLTLAVSALGACAPEGSTSPKPAEPPAVTNGATTPIAEPASAPAAAPTQAAAAPAPQATAQAKPSGDAKQNVSPAQNPANARDGGRRSKGSNDNKLETPYDLSKVADKPGAAATAEPEIPVEELADHEHAEAQDGSSLLPAAQAQKNSGRFELDEGVAQIKDLGKLRQGESSAWDFPFTSKGEGPLVVTAVKPSCGCTKAEIALVGEDGAHKPYTKGEPIPVGQKFVLEAEISTDGKPGGPFNAQISLYGNDPRGVFNVRLTADIEPVLTITPSQTVFFGKMTTADTMEQTVTVATTRGEPFKLMLGQEMVQGPIKLEYTAKNPDAEGKASEWTVKVTMGPNAEVGMRSYPINMKSDIPIAHPKYPSPDGTPQMHAFMLNVQAQVTGMVSAEPSFLTFGMVRPGETIERSLRIECHDAFKLTADIPVTFEGLQGQEFPLKDSFSVAVEPVEEGKAANLKVKLTGLPADLNGSFGGVLRVKVGHPHMDELQIRFSGVCRPPLPGPSGATPTPAGDPSVQAPPPQPK